jgi:hypothetical protein
MKIKPWVSEVYLLPSDKTKTHLSVLRDKKAFKQSYCFLRIKEMTITWFPSFVPFTSISSALIFEQYFSSLVLMIVFCCGMELNSELKIVWPNGNHMFQTDYLTLLICFAWIERRCSIFSTTFFRKQTTCWDEDIDVMHYCK